MIVRSPMGIHHKDSTTFSSSGKWILQLQAKQCSTHSTRMLARKILLRINVTHKLSLSYNNEAEREINSIVKKCCGKIKTVNAKFFFVFCSTFGFTHAAGCFAASVQVVKHDHLNHSFGRLWCFNSIVGNILSFASLAHLCTIFSFEMMKKSSASSEKCEDREETCNEVLLLLVFVVRKSWEHLFLCIHQLMELLA